MFQLLYSIATPGSTEAQPLWLHDCFRQANGVQCTMKTALDFDKDVWEIGVYDALSPCRCLDSIAVLYLLPRMQGKIIQLHLSFWCPHMITTWLFGCWRHMTPFFFHSRGLNYATYARRQVVLPCQPLRHLGKILYCNISIPTHMVYLTFLCILLTVDVFCI